jgi:hypothetical protein
MALRAVFAGKSIESRCGHVVPNPGQAPAAIRVSVVPPLDVRARSRRWRTFWRLRRPPIDPPNYAHRDRHARTRDQPRPANARRYWQLGGGFMMTAHGAGSSCRGGGPPDALAWARASASACVVHASASSMSKQVSTVFV